MPLKSYQLKLPVIVAPMFLVSGTELVIQSCINGVIGSFPALNGRTSEAFEEMLITVTTALEFFKNKTGQTPAPYAVNLIVHKSNPRIETDMALCVKYKVPIVITSLGAVQEVVDTIHSYGGHVYHDIINRRHAEKAAAAGVDGLICVCNGAGGHAGIANPMALIKEVRSVFDKTIILSGAITSGEDILAAQALGADYAYMGTRFITTAESLATDSYKQMILDAAIADIVYTDKISGVHANFLKKSIESAGINIEKIGTPSEDFSNTGHDGQKAWKDVWSAGQGAAAIRDILPVKALIGTLYEEYTSAYKNIRLY